MNLSEHKFEAERLIKATHDQLDMIAKSNSSASSVMAFLGVAQVTAALAQVHATLATATDV